MSGCFIKLKQIVFWFLAGVVTFVVIALAIPNTEQDQIKHTTDQIHKQLSVQVLATETPSTVLPPPQSTRPIATREKQTLTVNVVSTLPTNTPPPDKPDPTPSVPTLTVDGDVVNVRSGPGTNYPVIAQVNAGDTFVANGISPLNDWIRFCCIDNQNGWIWVGLARLDNAYMLEVPQSIPTPPPTSTPVPVPSTPVPVPQETFYAGTCAELKAAGVVPSGGWTPSSVNYLSKRDRDKDGYACE